MKRSVLQRCQLIRQFGTYRVPVSARSLTHLLVRGARTRHAKVFVMSSGVGIIGMATIAHNREEQLRFQQHDEDRGVGTWLDWRAASGSSSSTDRVNKVLGGAILSFAVVSLGYAFARGSVLSFYYRHMMLSVRNIKEGRVHTMATSTLTHGSIAHFMFNSICFYSLGKGVYLQHGEDRFVELCVAGGLGAGVLSLLYKTAYRVAVPSLGASGIAYALFGFFGAEDPEHPISIIFLPFWSFSAANMLYGIFAFDLLGLLGAARILGMKSFIDHAAHIGGLMTGLAISYWNPPPSSPRYYRRKRLWDDIPFLN